MKIIRKSLAVFLACIMVFSVIPIVPVFAGEIISEEVSKDTVVSLPEGYSFSGIRTIGATGDTYYYIVSEASQYGLVNGYWVDESGEVINMPTADFVSSQDAEGLTATIPSSYDSRNYGYITPVVNQIGGTCWAQSATTCLETSAIVKGYATVDTVDISPYHTVWFALNGYRSGVNDSANDGFISNSVAGTLNNGGNWMYASFALANYSGGALDSSLNLPEASNPSGSESVLFSQMQRNLTYATKYIHDYPIEDIATYNFTNSAVKQAVMEYGAVGIAYYASAYNYYTGYSNAGSTPATFYYPSYHNTDHAVTVVGWDDNFSRNNFSSYAKPQRDGAWLVKNSWGTGFGNDGYFWISYEDKTLDDCFTVYEAGDPEDYQNIYLYDGIGAGYIFDANAEANVFVAEKDEYITKVGYGYSDLTDNGSFNYTVKIYKDLPANYKTPEDGTLAYVQSGNTHGKRNIDITGNVEVYAGERFAVVIEGAGLYVEGDSEGNLMFNSNRGESFYLGSDNAWHDVSEAGYNNACVRAFTKDLEYEGRYKVTFICPDGNFTERRFSDENGNVELPHKDGYKYEFIYDGREFDGTNVTKDMYVITHCYSENGTPSPSCPCEKEFKCIYCGKKMAESKTEHTMKSVSVPAGDEQIGYTKEYCTVCDLSQAKNFKFSSKATATGVFSGGNNAWQIVNGVLTVGGEGDTPDLTSYTQQPWNSYRSNIIKINVNDTIDSLGTDILSHLDAVTQIYIGSSVKTVKANAFNGNSNVKTLVIPGSVKTIEEYAFSNMAELKDVRFAEGFTSLENCNTNAFLGCSKLEVLHIPSTLSVYANSIASTLSGLKMFDVAESNPYLKADNGVLMSADGKVLYAYPRAKTDVYYTVPVTVEKLAVAAFTKVGKLQLLDMYYSRITAIGPNEIYDCKQLTNINLPDVLNSISCYTLYGMNSNKKIFIPSKVTSIEGLGLGFTSNLKVRNDYTIYTDSETSAAKAYADSMGINCIVISTPHAFTETLLGTEPTCALEGINAKACECGNFAYSKVPATGKHNWKWVIDTEPTCITEGTKHEVCTNCGTAQNYDTVVPATGLHNYTAKVVNDSTKKSDANCSSAAVYYYSCAVCGKVENNVNHTFTSGSATGDHIAVTVPAKAPTCTTVGTSEYTACAVCGKALTQPTETPAFGHSFNDGVCVRCGYKCDHMCHATGGINAFFYKIARFFWKLFGTNKTCSCGQPHY